MADIKSTPSIRSGVLTALHFGSAGSRTSLINDIHVSAVLNIAVWTVLICRNFSCIYCQKLSISDTVFNLGSDNFLKLPISDTFHFLLFIDVITKSNKFFAKGVSKNSKTGQITVVSNISENCDLTRFLIFEYALYVMKL